MNATLPAAPVKSARKPKAAPVASLTLSIGRESYGVQKIDAGEFGSAAVRLTKRSDGTTYDVLVAHHGCECSCPDFIFRHADHGTPCKHIEAARSVGLIEAPDARRFPTPEDVAPVGLPAQEVRDTPAVEDPEEPSFAEELADAVGLPVLDSPADEPDPLAAWVRPARRSHLLAKPSERPVRVPSVPDGKYLLHELVDGTAALLRGEGTAVADLMAQALADLAASIRATGAQSVAEFTGRIASMEDDRLAAIRADAWDRGYAEGTSDRCCC